MNIKEHIRKEMGHTTFSQIIDEPDTEHGEPGRRVKLYQGRLYWEFFFADDRKITTQHRVTIIKSYFRNPERGSEFLREPST